MIDSLGYKVMIYENEPPPLLKETILEDERMNSNTQGA